MAEPARKIRNVETTEDVARPRDAAIRQAANDNSKYRTRYTITQKAPANLTYENDNDNVPYPTVSESFNEYASDRTIQPTNNTAPTSGRQSSVQYRASASTKNNTRQVQTTTRPTPNRAGRPTARPGLKRTLPNVPVLDVNPVKLARASTISISNISWGIGLWLSFQLPLAIIAVVFLGAAYIVHDVIPKMIKETTGELLYKGLSFIYNTFSEAATWLLDKIFGFDLTAIADPENYFILANFLVFLIGLSTLIIMAIIYQISLINCVFGKGSALKVSALIFATFAYMVPLLNLLPWFLIWVLVVWRYPE